MSADTPDVRDLLDEMRRRAARQDRDGEAFDVTRRFGSWELRVKVADADRLGVLIEGLEAERRAGAPAGRDLETRARALMNGVTGLGDRLALLELEPVLGRAVLRSGNPRLLPEGIEYDEAVLENDRFAVRRYRYDRAGGGRKAVSANLGAEALPRLVREIAEALGD